MMTAGGLRGDYRVICPAVSCVIEVQREFGKAGICGFLESQGFSEKEMTRKDVCGGKKGRFVL